ncbi:MAG: dihydropteroate synthase [Acetobacteraceae bacterium]
MAADGADILDIGGESTRPGAAATSPAEEQARVLPVIRALRDLGVPISVDTRNALHHGGGARCRRCHRQRRLRPAL